MAAFGSVQSWDKQVPKCWKDEDLSNFSRQVLAHVFPGKPEELAERSKLWRQLDTNASGAVSLAEFDAFFNHITGAFERKHGEKLVNNKSKLWVYARPCLIRAFNLANGVAPSRGEGDEDFVTRSEFRLLMVRASHINHNFCNALTV